MFPIDILYHKESVLIQFQNGNPKPSITKTNLTQLAFMKQHAYYGYKEKDEKIFINSRLDKKVLALNENGKVNLIPKRFI